MNVLKFAVLSAVAGCLMIASAPKAAAQLRVEVGVAPQCPYGYYDGAPYGCAPYGYYGSEWFRGGTFIGAGPWFHGDDNFRGRVNNRYHPEHGYQGQMPGVGERAESSRRLDKVSHFKGNETRDGRGHAGNDRH